MRPAPFELGQGHALQPRSNMFGKVRRLGLPEFIGQGEAAALVGPVGELGGDDGVDDLRGAVCDEGEELVGSVHLVWAVIGVGVQVNEACSVVGDDDGYALMDSGAVDVRIEFVWIGDGIVDGESADAVFSHGVHQSVSDCVDLVG